MITRLLTGRWRHDAILKVDTEHVLRILKCWAWSAAATDGRTGRGTWSEDFLAAPSKSNLVEGAALDNVAVPIGPTDLDENTTPRRFIHRSIREHLVAEYVAGISVGDAVSVLLPHIWFDPDWELVGPAALAAHPQRDELLAGLLAAAGAPPTLSTAAMLPAIDRGGEFRSFLARVAAESYEQDWDGDAATLIGAARTSLATSPWFDQLVGTTGRWQASGQEVFHLLVERVRVEQPGDTLDRVVRVLLRCADTDEHRRYATAMIERLHSASGAEVIVPLIGGIQEAAVSAQERHATARKLLDWMSGPDIPVEAAPGVILLVSGDDEPRELQELAFERGVGLLRRDGLTESLFGALIETLHGLRLSDEQREHLGEVVAEAIEHERCPDAPLTSLVREIIRAYPSISKRKALALILEMARQSLSGGFRLSLTGGPGSEVDVAPPEAREVFITLLGVVEDERLVPQIAGGLLEIGLAEAERRRIRGLLTDRIKATASPEMAPKLAEVLRDYDATARSWEIVRGSYLRLLSRPIGNQESRFIDEVFRLHPSITTRRQAAAVVLDISTFTDGYFSGLPVTEGLANNVAAAIAFVRSVGEEMRDPLAAIQALKFLYNLGGASDECESALNVAVRLLGSHPDARDFADGLETLLESGILDSEHQQTLCERATYWLAHTGDPELGSQIVEALAKLEPKTNCLGSWRSWSVEPSRALLGAVRANSDLEAWLTVLHQLKSIETDVQPSSP